MIECKACGAVFEDNDPTAQPCPQCGSQYVHRAATSARDLEWTRAVLAETDGAQSARIFARVHKNAGMPATPDGQERSS